MAALGGVRTAHDASVRRAYWTAWVATVTFFGGFYALLVPLPRYLAEAGLPDWQIGFVLGAFGVASLLGRPIAGVASDRFGPRRVMLVGAGSLLVGALGVPATTSLASLFLLRVLQATGYVAFTTAGTALIVALVPPQERGRRLAVFGAAANVAITITPAAVSQLMEVAPAASGLFVSAGLAALGGLLALTLGPRAGSPAGAALFSFAPILAERRGTVSPGMLYTVYGLGIIATRFVAGGLLDRLPVGRVMAVAAALIAGGYAVIALSAEPLVMAGATLMLAVGAGLFHPALIAHHAALLPGAPGRATAAFYVGFDVGIGAGSWLFGAVLQLAGVAALYWTAAALVAAVIPLTGRMGGPVPAAAPVALEKQTA
jgi:predicted MFS family arabinose efflux permease